LLFTGASGRILVNDLSSSGKRVPGI